MKIISHVCGDVRVAYRGRRAIGLSLAAAFKTDRTEDRRTLGSAN